MKKIPRRIGFYALLLAALCILFPPRRESQDGRDVDSIPPRTFIWSAHLYRGNVAPAEGYYTARIDRDRLLLELLLIASVSGALALLLRRHPRIFEES